MTSVRVPIGLGFLGFGMFWGAVAASTADFKSAFALSPLQLGLILGTFPIAGIAIALILNRSAIISMHAFTNCK